MPRNAHNRTTPVPPEQVQDSARRHGLTQLLLGQATDLTADPIDALNSTPFIVDDLSSAFGYVLTRYQAPRRPLPRTGSLVSVHRAPTRLALAVVVRATHAADGRAAALYRSTSRRAWFTDLILHDRSHL